MAAASVGDLEEARALLQPIADEATAARDEAVAAADGVALSLPGGLSRTFGILLTGDMTVAASAVVADSSMRLVQATSALGAPVVTVDDPTGRSTATAILLPGDVPIGTAVVTVDGKGRLIQGEGAEGQALVPIIEPRAQVVAPLIEAYASGTFDERGNLLSGVLLPSQLQYVRRQDPPTAVALPIVGASPNRRIQVVTRDGRTVTITPPDADPSAFVQNGDTVSYVRAAAYSGGAVEISDELLSKEAHLLSAGSVQAYFGFGQSNSNGGTNVEVVTPAPFSERALMFARGARLTQTVPASAALPLAEIACLRRLRESLDPLLNLGETPTSGVAYSLTRPGALAADVYTINGTFGVGGYPISALKKGTRPYANLLKGVTRAAVICAMHGLPFTVPAIWWLQGEANVNTAFYKADLAQLQTDLDTDIRAIILAVIGTAQVNPVLLAGAQSCSWTQSNVTTDTTPLAIVELAAQYPTRFICVGPLYPYPHTTNLHLTAASTRMFAETMGRAIARRIVDGVAQPSLVATGATRSGTTVTLTMAGAEGDLVLDTALVANTADGMYGVTFSQVGGNSVTVTGVAISGTDTLTVTLSAVPTGTSPAIGIARVGVSGALAGPVTGPRSCLRDSATATRADGSPLFKWACVQNIPIL
ncbi:hypothetical protein QOZ96_002464 [Brevundimonas nasdae]|uniref:sialate O-acetylesterase n=1 Tax=Brevundimonas nasdae TaxID=172043 RepID=UPI0019149112|nr:sialate O-acetylesterase [Brevundimonas nasdae]MBK6026042.1 hypothetical protein [Brevundimonas nasdae]MDQ0452511.1 hypothetical protein [Brevundimonas nasdae]